MLSKLFGTNARVKILKQTLLHPGVKFSSKELARSLKIAVVSVKREMDNLEKFGLLISPELPAPLLSGNKKTKDKVSETKKKNKEKANTKVLKIEKFYKINTDFVLYKEIKALIMKAQILYEKDFVEKIKKIGRLKLLIFSGFFVNDDASNVDLFIVGNFNKPILIKIINELEEDLGREINFTIMSEKEFKYRKDITDVFLYGILEGKKMVSVDSFENDNRMI